ncbi:MAG: hypothetical protein M5R36_04025, partial [Deltaproteobacteria bacterium]|nr:hypothetical protein [Deltaproteobacteria bacterium]
FTEISSPFELHDKHGCWTPANLIRRYSDVKDRPFGFGFAAMCTARRRPHRWNFEHSQTQDFCQRCWRFLRAISVGEPRSHRLSGPLVLVEGPADVKPFFFTRLRWVNFY